MDYVHFKCVALNSVVPTVNSAKLKQLAKVLARMMDAAAVLLAIYQICSA